METIREKVSYANGLIDGLDIKSDTKEGKVIKAIVGILEDMAEAIDEIDTAGSELGDYVEAIDEDLSELEEEVYGQDDLDDDGFIELECPNCKETVFIDENVFDEEDEIVCPNCNEPIELECDCCSDDDHCSED